MTNILSTVAYSLLMNAKLSVLAFILFVDADRNRSCLQASEGVFCVCSGTLLTIIQVIDILMQNS